MKKKVLLWLLLGYMRLASAQILLHNITFSGAKPNVEGLIITPLKAYSPEQTKKFRQIHEIALDMKDVFKEVVKDSIQVGMANCKETIALKVAGVNWIILPQDSLLIPDLSTYSYHAREEIVFMQMLYAIALHNTPISANPQKEEFLNIEKKMAFMIGILAHFQQIRKVMDFFMAIYTHIPSKNSYTFYPSREERLGTAIITYQYLADSVENIRKKERERADSLARTIPTAVEEYVVVSAPIETVKEAILDEAERLPKTRVTWTEKSYYFSSITEGEVVTHHFFVKNTGNRPLIITNIKPSCSCLASYYTKKQINPGESGEIIVEFNTKGKIGSQNESITITGNFEGDIHPQLSIIGEVVPNKNATKKKKDKK